MNAVSWDGLWALIAMRGERPRPRYAYVDGRLELRGSSRDHEYIRRCVAAVLEAYCLERDIAFTTYGHWLLYDESAAAAIEPDECYIFGPDPKNKPLPELAIEVVWTSGGIDKLEIYRRLRVGEVWFWKDEVITVYRLDGERYVSRDRSELLPSIDMALVTRLSLVEPTSEAARKMREASTR